MVLAIGLAACGSDKDKDYVEGSVEELYNSAMDLLLAEQNADAAKLFDEVDRQHPYSIWATKAQLMAAYAHYKDHEYDEAVIGLDRFVRLHPSNRDVPYAYYLKGLSFFERINDVKRDQTNAEQALKSFQDLLRRFAKTAYTRDAKRKIDLTRDHLAGREMEVGRYYQRQGRYLAAVNRFRTVIEKFQTTSHVPEALHRMAELYTALGVVDEAQKVAAILGYNYPASEWYIDSYSLVKGKNVPRPAEPNGDRSFMTRAWDWMF